MNPNAANDHDADLPAVRRLIARTEPTDGAVPLNGPVVFAWIDGRSSRTLHFAGDPLVVLPELEHTDAF
ncbi:MAG TPA: hypothetical protein VJS86_14630 [Arthrobacter sp.]|jgi:hypothetical protein|nr:hypothetical protein [Arthrobacter sp.]